MEPTASQNRINEGTHLKGHINSSGFFRIDGSVEGKISNPSKVVLGKTGVITGELECENADVEGRIEGVINITGTLSLKSTAHIEGDVTVGKLAVEPGAIFNASCAMQGSKRSTSRTKTKATETTEAPTSQQSINYPFERSQQRPQKPKAEQEG